MYTDNSYAVIDLDILAENFRAIREKAGVPVMAVVKADAYGHGAVAVAKLLQKDCAFFGVSSLAEGLELRRAGITNPILVLGRMPTGTFEEAIREGIRPTICRYEDAEALSLAAKKLGVCAPFHLAVDTGMSRLGFQVTQQDADICAAIGKLPGLQAEGVFTHFASADSADLAQTKAQAERFDAFCAMLEQRGICIPIRHVDNSAGIMHFGAQCDMVRAGIILYGLYPSQEMDPKLLSIRPALSWYTHVTHVKMLEPGRAISYGGTFVTTCPTKVATLCVGYADGYRRSLSNAFYVLIRGRKAPILGRICMDQMVVDVTDIPDVRVDDRVTLVGTDGENTITMEEISGQAGSFNYEFPCGISRRVPRIYLREGKKIHQVRYLLDK